MEKSISELVIEAHENAKKHGWWDDTKSFGDCISLVHSELSEALEFYREGKAPNDLFYSGISGLKPDGIPAELADVAIRIFDMCGWYGVDLEKAIELKMAYNKSRSYRHGGKAL